MAPAGLLIERPQARQSDRTNVTSDLLRVTALPSQISTD